MDYIEKVVALFNKKLTSPFLKAEEEFKTFAKLFPTIKWANNIIYIMEDFSLKILKCNNKFLVCTRLYIPSHNNKLKFNPSIWEALNHAFRQEVKSYYICG